MDIRVIDVKGESLRHCDIAYNGNSEFNESHTVENSRIQDMASADEPYIGMEFDSDDAAKNFYGEYARHAGFNMKVSLTKSNGTVSIKEFVCVGERKKKNSDNCQAMLKIETNDLQKWVVAKFVKDHSHSTITPTKVHYLRPNRHFAGAAKNIAETYQGMGPVPNGATYASKNTNFVNNVVRPSSRKRTLGKEAQNLLEYLKKMQASNPGFFYTIQLKDNCMSNVFWADARSRTAYRHFGDAVTLDTMYRVSQYRIPFAPFTGVNHHGQIVLFGCALLLDASEASFIWLFKTFLAAMNNRPPISIITDHDRSIQVAVSQVFPESRHCVSKWHVLREGQERLAYVCHAYPNFQAELYSCINLTETIEEFESSWSCILDKYNLRKNDWLQSLYNSRTQWVPVYFRDSFFVALSPNQRVGGSFFDGYVDHETTLPMFFRQYERALENWFQKEIESDFDTIHTAPLLKTPSPMENQAANLYTRKIFAKFQEELVETFVYIANRIDGDGAIETFRVAKYEDDSKAYNVTLNIPEMTAKCSCRMFEYSGILCRHVLTVFTVTNVLTLPSHYILKRWTRNAKNGVDSDEHISEHSQESLTKRYNSLCWQAMKYAEDGSITSETYNMALGALAEGGEKVARVKIHVAKLAQLSQVTRVAYADKKSSTSSLDTVPLLWPRQDEVTRSINLNDTSIPPESVTDLNLPHMALVSLHRDDGTLANMEGIPCLKSQTWAMENKTLNPMNRVALINLKLQDYSKVPSAEFEVKFLLSKISIEPILRTMSGIREQLSTPANKFAVINLKLQDLGTITGESEVKFLVSYDTLSAMLTSMWYISEQLPNVAEHQSEPKKQRK